MQERRSNGRLAVSLLALIASSVPAFAESTPLLVDGAPEADIATDSSDESAGVAATENLATVEYVDSLVSQLGSRIRRSGDGLGDGVAYDVLNMNGHPVTNLPDPFFEGDAVPLGYLNRHLRKMDDGSITGSAISDSTLTNVIVTNSQVKGGTFSGEISESKIKSADIEGSVFTGGEISGADMSGGSLKNAELSDVSISGATLDGPVMTAPTLEEPSVKGGQFAAPAIGNAVLRETTLEGRTAIKGRVLFEEPVTFSKPVASMTLIKPSLEGDISLENARLTNVPDANEAGDPVNLTTAERLIAEALADFRETLPQAAESWTETSPEDEGAGEAADEEAEATAGEVTPPQTLRVERYLKDHYSDNEAARFGDDGNATLSWESQRSAFVLSAKKKGAPFLFSATSLDGDLKPAIEVTADEGVTIYASGERRLKVTPLGAEITGDLVLSGQMTGYSAQYRQTPDGDAALGSLLGEDILPALSSIEAIVYRLPAGGLAIGIDPETVPEEMSFLMKTEELGSGETLYSIDYTQLIGPMAVAMTEMQKEIEALKAGQTTAP